jgi:hypothetical protein
MKKDWSDLTARKIAFLLTLPQLIFEGKENNMKKSLFISLLLGLVSFSTSLQAQETNVGNFYIGGGVSYAVEDFDFGNYDDSWGMNAKIGYHWHPRLDIEFDFDYLLEFKDEERIELFGQAAELLGSSIVGKADLNIMTYMISLKAYFLKPTPDVMFSVVAGGGIMSAEQNYNIQAAGISASGSVDEVELCGKLGLAFDIFANEDVSFGIEGNYTLGFGDLDALKYFNFTAGMAVHF